MTSDRPTILIVDDDPDLRELLAVVLTATADCLRAGDGDEALEVLAETDVDGVVLDVMMPRVDGFQVLEAIRGDDRLRHLPVVILTARSGQDWHSLTARMGADAHLVKPYDPDVLVAELAGLLAMTPEERFDRRADALAPLRPL